MGQKVQINLVQANDMTLIAKGTSNHWVTIDTKKEIGGSNAASTPVELFIMGLAGCTSMDVISILKKKRIKYHKYEVLALVERAEEHPKVFTNIELKFKFYGKDINEKGVKRAIELSHDKYCALAAMLKCTNEIKTSYEIIED